MYEAYSTLTFCKTSLVDKQKWSKCFQFKFFYIFIYLDYFHCYHYYNIAVFIVVIIVIASVLILFLSLLFLLLLLLPSSMLSLSVSFLMDQGCGGAWRSGKSLSTLRIKEMVAMIKFGNLFLLNYWDGSIQHKECHLDR